MISAADTAFILAAAGMVMWIVMEWLKIGRPTTLGAASGAIAGLATITPAAGFVGPQAAVVIGLIAGVICFAAVNLKMRLGYDDSLDVVGIHGVGGMAGTLLLGVFASTAVNPAGADGLLAGSAAQLGRQAVGVLVVGGYAFAVSWMLLKGLHASMGLRLSEENEVLGLDYAEHSETAYN
ncbi:MAG TPA: ammonium transporter [Desulfobacteraceae bacterium]|nr:ammonium transporter [Desulfobacteraceae bacterium]